jgi:undecaprenyl-diphosphatase
MIETLINLDRNLFLFINGMNSEFMDSVMWWVADRFFWIPLYLALAVFLVRKFGKQGYVMILFAALLIVLSDQGSVLMKNSFERMRPCHDDSLSFLVHTIRNKCGGQYGFVSSHAANTMALFTYLLLLARNSNKWITGITAVWVLLVGYCRVYMGVHFPADIAGGWMVGILAAGITYIIYRLIFDSPLNHNRVE